MFVLGVCLFCMFVIVCVFACCVLLYFVIMLRCCSACVCFQPCFALRVPLCVCSVIDVFRFSHG